MIQRLNLPTLSTFITCAATCALTSCALETLEIPDGERYTREFIKQLGPIDSSHDWNLSQRVTLKFASAVRKNVATVNVYNKMPGSPGCQIAACIRPDVDSFSFDYPGTALFAWVDGRDADGNVIFGDYYKIKDGLITLGEIGSRAVTFPSGIYTCEDISAYKAYDVEAIFDKPYGESDRTVVDYRWTPSDRSVFGNFSNAYNHALWERYDFSGKTSSDVFAEVVESIEKINLTNAERAETVVYSKEINNTANKFAEESFNNNPWPFHLGNGNGAFLVQETEREDDERDFSKLDGKIVLWQGIKKYSWYQDGREHTGYFWDAGSEWGLVLNKAYTMSYIVNRKHLPYIRMCVRVYYSLESERVPAFEWCEPSTVKCYAADGSECGEVTDMTHRVISVEPPASRSWRITNNWLINGEYLPLSCFKNGELDVSPAHDERTSDGLYVSKIILDGEQIEELFAMDKAVIRGHGLVIDRVTVQLLDVDDTPAIPGKVLKPAGEAPLNEALKFYAVKNDGRYLEPNFDDDSPGTSLQELMNLVGEHGVFNEGVNKQSHLCNMIRYKDRLPSMSEGVTFEVGDDGSGGSEVALHFLYGATGFNDCFGYFYYKGERPTGEELMKLPKYILIHNARPQRNLMASTDGHAWYHRPYHTGLDDVVSQIDDGTFEGDVPRIRRSQYKLVNFGYGDTPDPIGSTKFEAGTKIGFFMILSGYTKFWGGKDNYRNVEDETIRWMTCDDMVVTPSDIAFSFPEMNRDIGHVFSVNHRHDVCGDGDPDNRGGYKYQPQDMEDAGFMAFTRYSYGGYPLLSVEDWGVKGDHDMNDMIFYVSGVKTDDVKPVGTPVVQQSWLLLAEDLGGTFDLDFNDAVIGISHVATNIEADDEGVGGDSSRETTYGRVYLTGLAAGGTLPLEVLYDGRPISDYDIQAKNIKYFHEWFGLDAPRVTNAMGFDSDRVRSFLLSGIPSFNIAPTVGATHSAGTALSQFSIVVWRDGERKELRQFWTGGAEGVGEMDLAAPQLLIIPTSPDDISCWRYPYECTPIYEAYPGFKEWVGDKNKAVDWYKEANRDQRVKVVNHGWNGYESK